MEFFHQRTSSRKRKNTIVCIKDNEGLEHVNKDDIGRVAISYFRTMFDSSKPTAVDIALHDSHLT